MFGKLLKAFTSFGRSDTPPSIANRSSQKSAWLLLFPEELDTISSVLDCACRAYVINSNQKWQFNPSDTLGWIDTQFYGEKNTDFLELNCFLEDLNEQYGIKFETDLALVSLEQIVRQIIT